MASDELITGLEAAVSAAPQNRDLRLHLAQVLNEAGHYERALEHGELMLASSPADVAALAIAAHAAEQLGHPKATDYRTLADALTAPPTEGLQPLPAQGPALAEMPDSVDDLLDLWDDEAGDGPVEPDIGTLTRPGLTLADVGGMEEVKERLRMSFLAPMNNPGIGGSVRSEHEWRASPLGASRLRQDVLGTGGRW